MMLAFIEHAPVTGPLGGEIRLVRIGCPDDARRRGLPYRSGDPPTSMENDMALGGMQNQRRVHVSVTAAAGRTVIRAEERMRPYAGGIFGSIVGGGGGGLGGASVGVTMGTMHNPLLSIGVLTFLLGTAYTVARGIFTSTVRSRSRQLEHRVSTLASQSTELIADDASPRLPR
jgi:hypothetical protein